MSRCPCPCSRTSMSSWLKSSWCHLCQHSGMHRRSSATTSSSLTSIGSRRGKSSAGSRTMMPSVTWLRSCDSYLYGPDQ